MTSNLNYNTPMELLSDEELIERSRAERGSPKAERFLNELFQRHHAKVAGWCLRSDRRGELGHGSCARNIFESLSEIAYVSGEREVHHLAVCYYAKSLSGRIALKGNPIAGQFGCLARGNRRFPCENVSSELERRESEKLLRTLIRETLDEIETKVLILHYVNELPLDVVNRMLGLTNRSGAKAYIVSARRKLMRAHARWKARQPQAMRGGRGVK